jgi:hypothetical protein
MPAAARSIGHRSLEAGWAAEATQPGPRRSSVQVLQMMLLIGGTGPEASAHVDPVQMKCGSLAAPVPVPWLKPFPVTVLQIRLSSPMP